MAITWNPSDKSANLTLSNGDLTVAHTGSAGFSAVRATESKSSGKWYWEVTIDTIASYNIFIGILTSSGLLSQRIGSTAEGWGYRNYGEKFHNSGTTGTSYGDTYTTNDVIGIALDLDNGKIWWSKNGTWQASGDPVNGTNPAYTGISDTVFAAISTYVSSDQFTAAFKAVEFTYSAPSGFSAYDSAVNTITFTLPAITAQLGSGAVCNVTLPSFILEGQTGAQTNFTIPSFTTNLQTGALTNVTLPAFTWEVQAHQVYYMNVNFTLPCFSSNGELNSRGIAGNVTLPVFSSSLKSGSQANFNLPVFTASGNLTIGSIGSISQTLPSFIFSGSATVNYTGDIGFTLPSLYSSLQGKAGKLANISAALPAFRFSGLLYSTVNVTAEITLPSFKHNLTSTTDRFLICSTIEYEDNHDTIGSINIKLPVLTSSLTD